jgi:3-oxoacyl-[acyl-carrier protein] reductase
MRLKGKTVMITGASRGIGKTSALMMAKEGADMILCDVSDAVQVVADEIQAFGGKAISVICNVTDRDSVQAAVEQAVAVFGKVDVLVNNAGVTGDATLLKMSEEQWDKVIDVNLKGTFNMGQAVAKVMTAAGGGAIINTASVVGLYGNFGQSNYAATKWGVIGLTKTWCKELGKFNVRVNAVAPGFIMTEMTAAMPDKVLDMMKDKSPLKRLGTPEDVANAYIFLASDEAAFMSGSVLSVDGGVVL